MKRILTALLLLAAWTQAAPVVYDSGDGPGKGKHIVFLTGDEEYRSEEGLPMLAKILSQRHGFKCTVLFALDADGTINPDNTQSLDGAEALDSADAIVMLVRFRAWPDEQMKHFVDAYRRGVPIVALRTSTHAFKFDGGAHKDFNGFGKRVLGEQWVSHWGKHKVEATRGIIDERAKDDPILRGVTDVFADSDVYEAYPPKDATILIRGQVLKGMKPTDAPADYAKQRASDGRQQPINDPMMPVAWTRIYKNEAGNENKILCTTMGAATDLQSEGLRRLIVNGVYWGLGLGIPPNADVNYVGEYRATMYGFKGFVKGVKPADHALQKSKPDPLSGKRGSGLLFPLQLKPNDHIAIIGNALADRIQHDGYFETLIAAKFSNHNLVIRNLAVAGDEINTWHRSENFGTREQWLDKVQASVVFAFYGFNESFKGDAGLPQFKADLDKFLKETLPKRRVALFSPIAADHPKIDNATIKKYVDAMREIALANGVPFADLFTPTLNKRLTINGLHLSDAGDKYLAPIMFESLFHEPAPVGDFEKLRAAINEKNGQWHARYRTVDGYNVYGGRSQLVFPTTGPTTQITNYHVMQEEMSQRDVLTANRDKKVWAIARGEPYVVDDSNLPPVTPVPTNKPGPTTNKTAHTFLPGEDAIAKMKVHAGCKVNLFASEENFPDLVNPVQMLWDQRGRLWVAAWRNYPERTPTSKIGDKILILEDTDRDGRADRCTTFLDDLNCPTGFQFHKDGVLVMQAPDLWFVRDTDNDGQADTKERVVMGLDSADSHHTTNSICHDPGGAVYLSDGVFHRTQVETAAGPVRNNDGAIYRFHPRTGEFETYIAYNFANPHGRVFDYWGNDFVTDATGNNTYFGPAFSGRLDYPHKHRSMKELWPRPARPSPGTNIVTSRHFPDDWQGNFLNCNVISFQGIYRVKLIEDGSGIRGEKQEDLVSSTDPNFRPTAVNVGPDGAIYFADWHNPIIGHMQHHIRDPNRDHEHGRIYRITYEGRPLETLPKIDGAPVAALLDLLKDPQNQVREWAKLELDRRDTAEVISALKQWIASLDLSDSNHEHHMTEALWLHQWHDAVDLDLLKRNLNSTEPHTRAAATRVLCYWRDRVPDALALLAARAIDENPRVRLEAIRAASFFSATQAVEIALSSLRYPTDYYLSYTLGETIRQLEPQWRDALTTGKPLADNNPAGLAYLLANLKTADLLALVNKSATQQALLTRSDISDANRHKVLSALADQRKTLRSAILLDAIDFAQDDSARINAARLLPQLTDLATMRTRLTALTQSQNSTLRHYALAAVATADKSFDAIWSDDAPADVLACVPLVYDPFIRNRAYKKIDRHLYSNDPAIRQPAIRAAVSITRNQGDTFIALADLIAHNHDIPTAATALRSLPSAAIDKSRVPKITAALVAWAKSIPASDRTSAEYLSTIQSLESLVGELPTDRATEMIAELKNLRVPVFAITTVREQMRYDTRRLIVEAGKPFEIRFENTDLMPHNLVIVAPNQRERIGKLAMTLKLDQLDSAGRPFVPTDPAILAATRLLESGKSEILKLTAPADEGDYEYVCTYPDHWQVMWGRLVVTKDVDAYLRTHRGAPPATTQVSGHHAHQHR